MSPQTDGKPAVRWVFYAVGAVMAVYGATQLYGALSGSRLVGWAAWVVGGALIHDLVVAPTVALIGLGISRLVPQRARSYVAAALIVSGMVLAVAWPFVFRLGYDAGVPSALPLDYATGLALVIATIWTLVALVAVVIELRRSRAQVRGDVSG